MLVTCESCKSTFDIQQPGVYKCSVCGNILPEVPACAGTTVDTASQSGNDGNCSRKKIVKTVIIALVAVLALTGLGFGGWWAYRHFFCKNALDYVPEGANYLIYGNTELLFDTKIWQTFSDNKMVKENFIKRLKESLDVDSLEELEGNFVIWGHIPDEPTAAVIVLDNNNAASIFDTIKKKNKDNDYLKVEVENVEGGRKLIISYPDYSSYDGDGKPRKYKADWSLTQIGDDVLQVYFNGEQGKIFEPDGDNKMAKLIDRSAVAAAAVSPQAWDKIESELKKEGVKDSGVDRLGYGVVEVFCNKKELKVEARLDISEL